MLSAQFNPVGATPEQFSFSRGWVCDSSALWEKTLLLLLLFKHYCNMNNQGSGPDQGLVLPGAVHEVRARPCSKEQGNLRYRGLKQFAQSLTEGPGVECSCPDSQSSTFLPLDYTCVTDTHLSYLEKTALSLEWEMSGNLNYNSISYIPVLKFDS